jgi:hypothetical protein
LGDASICEDGPELAFERRFGLLMNGRVLYPPGEELRPGSTITVEA